MTRFKLLVILAILTIGLAYGPPLLNRQTAYSPVHTVSGQSAYTPKAPKDVQTIESNSPPDPEVLGAQVISPLETKAAEKVDGSKKTVSQQLVVSKNSSTQTPSLAIPAVATKTPSTSTKCGGTFTQELLCLINEYRASKNLGALAGNASLSKVALGHSKWMSSTDTFSHTGINGSRLTERCAAAGISCHAENLGKGVQSAQTLLDMWKNSPGHNANLLGKYSIIGIGVQGDYVTLLLN